MQQTFGLFPIPLTRVQGAINASLIQRLKDAALASNKSTNVATHLLSHTRMLDPGQDALFAELAGRIQPELVQFGRLLFGETLNWRIKEMWMHVLERGGSQFMHTHANSFISAILYLTRPDPSARTIFHKSLGSAEFVFKNDGPGVEIGEFNGDKWFLPNAEPGDLILYPSHLLHGVPPNQGGRRISIALNAIPDRLNSQGYRIAFSCNKH
ncbi:MAG: hypothetical protein N838_01255 [Thiohalocapsa sp. PB-PSB1]|nr:MAG: hypothetical protein N838_03805 [Thiohalocapsa sp. PB-PSB1]QQO52208.1 MAG: hypothetical protein N838_01255 [Thiohalocapsa sp. PB-PSB1]HCS90170.1 hypothetical protein [Chromatiaceae bacterium]